VPAAVSTPAFEGPIELLLQLVNSHDVDLFEVPLAAVVEGFVTEVASWDEVDLPVLSEFLLVAAVLIELKSRRLLPGAEEGDQDEELVGWEERDLLLARLLECQAYAAAGDAFSLMMEQAARSVARTVGFDPDLVVTAPDLLAGVVPQDLHGAYLRATAERPVPVVDLYHVTVETVTVADAVQELTARLPRSGRATFRQLTGHLTSRIEVIVRFLALLELHKRGQVTLEAVLMVAVEPVGPGILAELLEVPVERIDPIADELIASCREGGRGFQVVRVAGGLRIQTHPDLAPYVERFANVGVSSRLSAAALETLAIVAYRQPVSRAQIAALRGVNVDGVVRLLEHRGYIEPVGRAPGPGQPVLYATTDAFLERLGLDRLDQLPPVEDLLPGPEALAEYEEQLRPLADG
jgi:segregation and condensation protein B